MSRRPISIANCSGFYGDRFSAPAELLAGPEPIDVLTGDYLAELTLLILAKARRADPQAGFATTFLRQIEPLLATVAERGVKVVSNAGGLNPAGLRARIEAAVERLGLSLRVAHVEGDDCTGRLEEFRAEGLEVPDGVVSANAYLGGFGIARALAEGADLVVTGRVTDAALVVGPAAWWHGWSRHDLDELAGAVVAGHVIECGAQATGGNYPFLEELAPGRPGFPIALVAADGSSVITKQPGTGGVVNLGTVRAQLLYEIGAPDYQHPDVTAWFDSVTLTAAGPDRVAITAARGTAPPPTLKVATNIDAGYRNTMTMVITGLDVEAKAAHALDLLAETLGGTAQFAHFDAQLVRSDRPDPPSNDLAMAQLRVTVRDPDPDKVGRRFSGAVVELALASYAGFFVTTPPSAASAYGVYRPLFVDAALVPHVVVHADGRREEVASAFPPSPPGPSAPQQGYRIAQSVAPLAPDTPLVRAPLGAVCGARSGDKGGDANIGVWVHSADAYAWIVGFLTTERIRELVPEAADLAVRRYEFANLWALNFVVEGILGDGVAATTRIDAQAKGLGEFLRARVVEIPAGLLGTA